MKRLIYLTAISALALVSCSKQQALREADPEEDLIRVTAYTSRDLTKGDPVTNTQYPFNLYVTYGSTSPIVYVPSTAVTYSTDKWVLSGGTKYYWPSSLSSTNNLQFYGVMNNASTTITSRAAMAALEVNSTTGVIGGSEDLCTAYANVTSKPSGGTQPLIFTHALTKICFTVKGGDSQTYVLTKITVTAKKEGTFTLNGTSWALSDNAAADYTITSGFPDISTTQSVAFGTLMIIPQDAVTLKVEYQVKSGDTVIADYTGDNGKTKELSLSARMGKSTQYNLILESSATKSISFTSSQSDWSAQTTDNTLSFN